MSLCSPSSINWYYPLAGKVTVGLASHWICLTQWPGKGRWARCLSSIRSTTSSLFLPSRWTCVHLAQPSLYILLYINIIPPRPFQKKWWLSKRSGGKVHSIIGNWCRGFVARCPSCRRPVLKHFHCQVIHPTAWMQLFGTCVLSEKMHSFPQFGTLHFYR